MNVLFLSPETSYCPVLTPPVTGEMKKCPGREMKGYDWPRCCDLGGCWCSEGPSGGEPLLPTQLPRGLRPESQAPEKGDCCSPSHPPWSLKSVLNKVSSTFPVAKPSGHFSTSTSPLWRWPSAPCPQASWFIVLYLKFPCESLGHIPKRSTEFMD